MIYQYVCKFYLNASHFIYIDGRAGEVHSHCFEFSVDVAIEDQNNFISFTQIENKIEETLSIYEGKLINEIAPFDTLNPTLENIAQYFKETFTERLKELNGILLTLELSETPSRAFIINAAEEEMIKRNTPAPLKETKVINIWDYKNDKAISAKKVVNAEEFEFDYLIPDELMHFDVD